MRYINTGIIAVKGRIQIRASPQRGTSTSHNGWFNISYFYISDFCISDFYISNLIATLEVHHKEGPHMVGSPYCHFPVSHFGNHWSDMCTLWNLIQLSNDPRMRNGLYHLHSQIRQIWITKKYINYPDRKNRNYPNKKYIIFQIRNVEITQMENTCT